MKEDLLRVAARLAAMDIVDAATRKSVSARKSSEYVSRIEPLIFKIAQDIAEDSGETDWLGPSKDPGWTDKPGAGEGSSYIGGMSAEEKVKLMDALGLDDKAIGKMFENQVKYKPELKSLVDGPAGKDLPPPPSGLPEPPKDLGGDLPSPPGMDDLPSLPSEGELSPPENPDASHSERVGVDPVRKYRTEPNKAKPRKDEFNTEITDVPGIPGDPRLG